MVLSTNMEMIHLIKKEDLQIEMKEKEIQDLENEKYVSKLLHYSNGR